MGTGTCWRCGASEDGGYPCVTGVPDSVHIDPRDAEIARLKAEVERLTADLAHARRMIETERASREVVLTEKAKWQTESQRTRFAQARAEKAEAEVERPGRLLSFHCMLLPTSKARDGYIGLTDFRGELIRTFREVGWIHHSEVVIWKDPVTAMQRTKALGLLHKQIRKDSCMSRQGIPDYLITMRKPGDNPEPVSHTGEGDDIPVSMWQRFASPVWMDIDQGDTLQRQSAREDNDEKHICPLQLEVIRRALKLWTNPGDTVLSPFAGIGSEGHVAVQMGRKFVGAELKGSYYAQAVKNLHAASPDGGPQVELFA